MGNFMSRRSDDAKAGIKAGVATAVVRSKLADLKATKVRGLGTRAHTTLDLEPRARTVRVVAFEVGRGLAQSSRSVKRWPESLTTTRNQSLHRRQAQRDFQVSMTMAKLRDQMHFMLGFYGLLVGATAVRAYRYKKFEPVPLSSIPFIAGPVFFAYNLDASYGNKLERLNQEAAMIRGAEQHWFNDPINLPRSLEADYRSMLAESNSKLLKINAKPEPDWATFNETTIESLVDGSTPLSRTLHSLGAL